MQHYYHLLAQVQVDLYAGRAAQARDGLHAAMPRVRRSLFSHIESFKAITRSLLARCALGCAEADPTGGAALIAEARREIKQLRRSGAPWSAAAATLHEAGALACEGARDGAVARLRMAIEELDRADLKSFATAGRRRLGEMLGGDEGAALIASARAVEAAEGIVDAEAFTRLHAPGFGPRQS
jgi:hypothetical protein